MLTTTSSGMPAAEFRGTSGFDPAPIYKKRREFLNDFDRFRLELIVWKHYEPFGYKPKLYDGTQYTEIDVIKLLEMPFRFEEYTTEVSPEMLKTAKKAFIERAMFFYHRNLQKDGYNGLTPANVIWPKEELRENPLYE